MNSTKLYLLLSLHLWATHTTTLSYTQYFSGSSANFLIGISKVYHKGPTSQPNLDSATTYHHSFLLRKRQDCVFRCDYVSTFSLWTSFRKLNLISLLSHIQILKVSHEYLTPVSADRKNSRWNGIPIYNRGVQFSKFISAPKNRAGVGGFEPPYAGVKVLCLTAWRYPNIARHIVWTENFYRVYFFLMDLLNMSKGSWRDSNPRIVEPQSTVLTT